MLLASRTLLMPWPQSAGRCSEKSLLAPAALGERLSTPLIPFTFLLSIVGDLKNEQTLQFWLSGHTSV